MRNNLADDSESDTVSYRCSAHYLNLWQKMSKCLEWKNTLFKSSSSSEMATCLQHGIGLLVGKWMFAGNTLSDCLKSYLDNWSVLLKVCDEHRDEIVRNIAAKVKDFALKRNAEDYLQRMRPIAVALDRMQSDSCKISDAVHVWKKLEDDLKGITPTTNSDEEVAKPHQASSDTCSLPCKQFRSKAPRQISVRWWSTHCNVPLQWTLPNMSAIFGQHESIDRAVQTIHVLARNGRLSILPDMVAITGKSSKMTTYCFCASHC